MLTQIKATYKVVTPMFCAGADPNDKKSPPELRLQSFKGVLRFWWRALAWSRYGADLETIRNEEDKIFGSTSGGRSRVSMRLVHPESGLQDKIVKKDTVLKNPGTGGVVGQGARYLGYGVMEAFARTNTQSGRNTQAGQLTRACLQAPFVFAVKMRGRDLSRDELTLLHDALVALGTLGGMGAKSRKGYGSLVLQSLQMDGKEEWNAPDCMNDLCERIKSLQSKHSTVTPPEFTALSGMTRHVLVSSNKTKPVELLDLVGRELVRYRSWGRNGTILKNQCSEKLFKDDHDLMMRRNKRRKHPRRIAFGLPHNYGKKPDQKVGPLDEHIDRRASPLFVHIHKCDGVPPIAVLSLLPARFLPKNKSRISVGGTDVPQVAENDLYCPIHDFLDRLLDPSQRIERFTYEREIKP